MRYRFFFDIHLYCPLSKEDAWKRLLAATENRTGKKPGLKDFLDVTWCTDKEYFGWLKPYEFRLTPLHPKGLFGLRKHRIWTLRGDLESFKNGCKVEGWIQPRLGYIVMMALLFLIAVFGFLYWLSKPESVSLAGLGMATVVFLFMLGLWKRACAKHKSALCELLGGRELVRTAGGIEQ